AGADHRRPAAQGGGAHHAGRPTQKNTTACTRAQQRSLIDHHRTAGGSIRGGCLMIGLPRSSYYYRPHPAEPALSDAELLELIDAIQREFPYYGVRRVHAELRRRG